MHRRPPNLTSYSDSLTGKPNYIGGRIARRDFSFSFFLIDSGEFPVDESNVLALSGVWMKDSHIYFKFLFDTQRTAQRLFLVTKSTHIQYISLLFNA